MFESYTESTAIFLTKNKTTGVEIKVFRVVGYFTDCLSSATPEGPLLGLKGQKILKFDASRLLETQLEYVKMIEIEDRLYIYSKIKNN